MCHLRSNPHQGNSDGKFDLEFPENIKLKIHNLSPTSPSLKNKGLYDNRMLPKAGIFFQEPMNINY